MDTNMVQIIHCMLHSMHSDRPVRAQTKLFIIIFIVEDHVSGINLPVQWKERKVIEAVSWVYNLPLCSYPQTDKIFSGYNFICLCSRRM